MRIATSLALAILAAPAICQLAIPKRVTSYTSNRARGTFFQAPGNFIITHLQVPDDSAPTPKGLQATAIYKLTAAPPAYSSTVPGKPVFFAKDVPSDQYIRVIPPIIVNKDDWIVALGVCYAKNATVYSSSYGASNFGSSVLGNAITMKRCGTQDDFVNLNGVITIWSEVAGSNGRVRIFVAGQGDARLYGDASGAGAKPKLDVSDEQPPSIGKTAGLMLNSGAANPLTSILLLSATQAKIAAPPYGTLLVGLPLIGTFIIPGVTPTPTPIQLPLPADKTLLGAAAYWQSLIIRTPTSFGMTNGLAWRIGQ